MYGQAQKRSLIKAQNGKFNIDSTLQVVPEVGSNSGRDSDNIAMAGHYMDVNIASAMKKTNTGNDKNKSNFHNSASYSQRQSSHANQSRTTSYANLDQPYEQR